MGTFENSVHKHSPYTYEVFGYIGQWRNIWTICELPNYMGAFENTVHKQFTPYLMDTLATLNRHIV